MPEELVEHWDDLNLGGIGRVRNMAASVDPGDAVPQNEKHFGQPILAAAAMVLNDTNTAQPGKWYFLTDTDQMLFGRSDGTLADPATGKPAIFAVYYDFRTVDYTTLNPITNNGTFTVTTDAMDSPEFDIDKDAVLGMQVVKTTGASNADWFKFLGTNVQRSDGKGFEFIYQTNSSSDRIALGFLHGDAGVAGNHTSNNQIFSAWEDGSFNVRGFKRVGGNQNTTDFIHNTGEWIKIIIPNMGTTGDTCKVVRISNANLVGDALFDPANEAATPVPLIFVSAYNAAEIPNQQEGCFGAYIEETGNSSPPASLNILALKIF